MTYNVKAINTKTGDIIEFEISGDTEAKCLLAAKRKADEIFPSGLGKIIVQLTISPKGPLFAGMPLRKS